MDLLNQYEQQDALAPARRPIIAPPEGFFIRLVIKLSGGKIHDRRQALMILLIFAGIAFFVAALLIFQNTGVTKHPLITAPPPETVGRGGAVQ